MNYNYFKNKKALSEKALVHTLRMERDYPKQIQAVIQSSYVFGNLLWPEWFPDGAIESPWEPMFIEDTTSGAIDTIHHANPLDTICALNFASFKNPGGKFLDGSSAQEESLCHTSGLYNILRAFSSSYYAENRGMLNNSLYKNRAIYSPCVPFIGKDDSYPVDILTCAAPNTNAAIKYKRATPEECQCALIDRILYLFKVLLRVDESFSRINHIILGAFGCGVFGNDVKETATIFSHTISTVSTILRQRGIDLPKIYFAIPRLKSTDYTMDDFAHTVLTTQEFLPVDTCVPINNVEKFRKRFL